jgi:hypothetical protein
MQSRFTHITVDIPVVPNIVRNELTPALSKNTPGLEIDCTGADNS